MRRLLLAAVVMAASVSGLTPATQADRAGAASLPATPRPGEMVVKHSLHNDTSRPLGELAWGAYRQQADSGRTVTLPGGRFENQGAGDPVVVPDVSSLKSSGTNTAVSPAPILSFDGLSSDDNAAAYGFRVMPPDTTGDVGPNHYVQAINLLFRVWDKSGAALIPPTKMSTLFAGFGGACEVRNDGDPIVLYDQLADRWMLTQFAVVNPAQQCIAISTGPNPLGTYHRYSYDFGSFFNDYPHFGLWPDAYYASFHLFQGSYAGLGAAAFDRTKMLAGLPATMIFFNAGGVFRGQGHGALPSDLDGMVLPPAGSPNIFVDPNDDEFGGVDRLDYYSFHADFAEPDNSSFEITGSSPLPAFTGNLCGYVRDCIPQAGASQRIDALSGRGMYRVYYRNRGGYGQYIGTVTVDSNGADHAAPMWYELRDPGSGPRLWQTGTYAPDTTTHRWMGAIGSDRSGNIALGYSASSSTINPGVRYAVRTPSDPLGTLQAEATLVNGSGAQTGGPRWGDYSTMATDPADDCTFWYTQEYGKVTGSFLWHSRIGSFKVPACGPAPGSADLRVSQTAAPNPGTVGQPLAYTVTVTNDGPGPATGVTLLEAVPEFATLNSITPSQGTCAAPANGLIVCSMGSLANGAAATVTVNVTPTREGPLVNAAGVNATEADPNLGNNSNALQVFIVGIADLSLTLDATNIVLPGDNIEYDVQIRNQGTNTAFSALYTQSIPSGTTFVPSPGCTEAAGVVQCTRPTLQSGGVWTFTITVTPSAATGLVATVSGTASSITPDPDQTDNFRTEKSIVLPNA